mmetsp:Transcript_1040/g.2299  ORF Transcript_1040/g.2299 Transcript_1040/m.2299 type:complete len:238 (+) Transcript_1040:174-887(+)
MGSKAARTRSLAVQRQERLHISFASHDNWAPRMNVVRHNIQYSLNLAFKHPCRCHTSGLFGDHSHRESFIQHAQFALLGLLVSRVVENASIQQRSVDVSNHGSNISSCVALVLYQARVLFDGVIPIQRVAFVARIDLLPSILGKLHVAQQDKLADGGVQRIPAYAIAPCDHQLTSATIHRVARSDDVGPWSQNVSHFTNSFSRPSLVHGKDRPHRDIAIDVGGTVQRIKSNAIWARH